MNEIPIEIFEMAFGNNFPDDQSQDNDCVASSLNQILFPFIFILAFLIFSQNFGYERLYEKISDLLANKDDFKKLLSDANSQLIYMMQSFDSVKRRLISDHCLNNFEPLQRKDLIIVNDNRFQKTCVYSISFQEKNGMTKEIYKIYQEIIEDAKLHDNDLNTSNINIIDSLCADVKISPITINDVKKDRILRRQVVAMDVSPNQVLSHNRKIIIIQIAHFLNQVLMQSKEMQAYVRKQIFLDILADIEDGKIDEGNARFLFAKKNIQSLFQEFMNCQTPQEKNRIFTQLSDELLISLDEVWHEKNPGYPLLPRKTEVHKK